MHGKISYYGDKTGIGTITNQNRRVFEFGKIAWHDPKSLPERDMFVDFRIDEKGKVVSIRESTFKKLSITHGITEDDFWSCADDKILEDRAKNLKDELINRGLNTLNPKKPLKANRSIDECFDIFFSDQIEMVYKYEELLVEPQKYSYIDYPKMKRFLQKAKTQLLNSDTSISHEHFSEIEQELTRLEYLITNILRAIKTDITTMFEEIFLENQILYLRTKRRVTLELERTFQLEKMIEKSRFDIDTHKQRAKRETKESEKQKEEQKVELILKNRDEWKKEIDAKNENIKHFKNNITKFEKKYFTEFINGYNFEKEEKRVYKYLKMIMDYVAYVFDHTIWKLAMNSKSIENSFYSHNAEGSFCAFTFLRYYLKPLDKLRLSENDKALYQYLLSYEKKHSTKILLLSEESDFSMKCRILLFGSDKDFLIFSFPRAIDSMQWVKGEAIDILLIDNSIYSLSIYEYLKYFKSINKNPSVKILCFLDEENRDKQAELKSLGVDLFLKKPLNKERLKEVIKKISDAIKRV